MNAKTNTKKSNTKNITIDTMSKGELIAAINSAIGSEVANNMTCAQLRKLYAHIVPSDTPAKATETPANAKTTRKAKSTPAKSSKASETPKASAPKVKTKQTADGFPTAVKLRVIVGRLDLLALHESVIAQGFTPEKWTGSCYWVEMPKTKKACKQLAQMGFRYSPKHGKNETQGYFARNARPTKACKHWLELA